MQGCEALRRKRSIHRFCVSRLQASNKAAINNHIMATARPCLAQLSRICLSSSRPASANISARFLSTTAPLAARGANASKILSKQDKAKLGKSSSNPQKNKKKGEETKKKKKARTTYKQYDPKELEQFSLCDAMRYVQKKTARDFTDGLQIYTGFRGRTKANFGKVRDGSQVQIPEERSCDPKSITASPSRQNRCPDMCHLPARLEICEGCAISRSDTSWRRGYL